MTTSAIYRNVKGDYVTDKDPNDELEYVFNWSDWLTKVDDTKLSHELIAEGVVLGDETVSATAITVFVSGGTVGVAASVTCRIRTATRAKDKTLHFNIVEQ